MPISSHLTLFILRHGKAHDHAKTDFDRPLTKRGQQQSIEKGNILRQITPLIDTILCSAAQRTCETLDGLGLAIKKSSLLITKDLYLCNPEILLSHIQQINHGKTALLIGHNPGLHQFLYDLLPFSSSFRTKEMDELASAFPTGALAEVHFSCTQWSDINWHQGSLISYHK